MNSNILAKQNAAFKKRKERKLWKINTKHFSAWTYKVKKFPIFYFLVAAKGIGVKVACYCIVDVIIMNVENYAKITSF
jgi:hypothetical protein